ncbi:hypothetical protein CGLO_00008 [Colletotrichum gloeosporioides Cg-14]|uniref:Uncharacterized protein n=1 Tax=Colletotrichum gloeosporioides (strain Cg-14) TaxID=1237896 RepID=T0KVL4_COLGC|nr:hypothetical protein CGLO_00008 [Colletotrichum gloeosporioides Cg-14]
MPTSSASNTMLKKIKEKDHLLN